MIKNTLEYSWDVKDLRPEGLESAEFYKPDADEHPFILSITRADGKAVSIRVDGEMRLSKELEGEYRDARCSPELPDIGVTDEESLGEVDFDRNPWFDAYEHNDGPYGDEEGDDHLDMVHSCLSHIIADVVHYLKEDAHPMDTPSVRKIR